MKYYNLKEDRIITTEELVARYGSDKPIAELDIYYLSVQPDYIPFSYNELPDGTYYPVESYISMQIKAIKALVDAGLTQEAAMEALQ